MASHSLKRKAEKLSALVDRINSEIGAGSTGKKSRLDSGLTPKTKAELLKAFVDQHLNENDEVKSIAPDSPATTLDQVTETPIVLDREAFLKRLQTYSALFTYGKPITPVECARHGWIDTRQYQTNHLVSKLRCELCSGVIYVTDVKHGASEELLHSIREKYLKGLSELHEKNCIWKYSECDEWVYSFPFYTSYDAVKQWQENVGRLIASNITLPTVQSPLTPENLILLQKILKLEHELDNSGPTADWLKHSQLACSLILPLFGWNLHIIEERPLLKCDLCFRALGLWNYNNTDVTMNAIDAEKEHRPYCPWINRGQAQITSSLVIPYSSQKSAQSVCGWEFMLNTIIIECKHLEEMYDLSPKAEQQRKKLHNEAQILIKAAKSRLIEVLNGKWMKEVVASPVINRASEPLNEPVAQKPVEQVVQGISEAEAEQRNESVSEEVQKTSRDNENLSEDLVQATTDITDMEYAENIDQAQPEPTTEEMIEAPASPNIPVEIKVSTEETDEQKPEVSAGEAHIVADVATPELQTLEVIRDSAKIGSPGSSLDVNLSTFSSPRRDFVDIDVSASPNEEVSVDISEHEQAVTGAEEEILEAEEPVIEVGQTISLNLESENIPQELESPAPSSVVSLVEESESKQQIAEVDENITDANEFDGDIDTTENADLSDTIESQLADDAQISALDASETINQYEEQHLEEQVQEQVEAQEDSSKHAANFESTAVDEETEETEDQMIATEDNTETLTEENAGKEDNHEGIEVENSQAVAIDVDVNEVLVEDHDENLHETSDEIDEVQQDVTHDAQLEEETAEKAVQESLESANEDGAEQHENAIEESDLQQVIENEGMTVDMTGNEDEQVVESMKDVHQDILAAADDETMAEDTEDMNENVTEDVAEDVGEVEDEGVHEEVATDHMMEEVVENTIDDENKDIVADTHMETQADVLEEEESEDAVDTDNDMSQYVEDETIIETDAPEEQKEGDNELKEGSGENALLEMPIATEQVSTPSAFAGYDDITDNHEVLSPATTAAINEQINNMDNDNDLVPQPEKTGEEDERVTMTETQESQTMQTNASSDKSSNDAVADSIYTTQNQEMDDEVVTEAAEISDDHDFPEFSEANANEEQEQNDPYEDVSKEHVTNEELEQNNSHEDVFEEHMQTGEVESHSTQANTIVVQESSVANGEDNAIPAQNEVIQGTESTEQVLSDIQEVEDDTLAQSFDEQDDNIPIQVEEISADTAEQQSLDIANQKPTDEHYAEQEVAESNNLSTETIEDVLSGDIDESDHNLKIEDVPQNESSGQENLTAKDQDIEENDQEIEESTLQDHILEESQVFPSEAANLTTGSEQGTANDDLVNNKVSIEVDGDALIEEPDTEHIEAQAEVDDGNLAPEDDGQLDDYIDADQFDSIETEQIPDDLQPQSESTALVSIQANDTSGQEQDIVTIQNSSVADIPDQNADISDAYELANDEEVAVMLQTETEQPMEGLESVADDDNHMRDSNNAQAPNFTAVDADETVIVAQSGDASMDTEEVTIEDAGMLDLEEMNHD